ncbi:MAG TPA: vitamin K epoxide reductase family protein [Longimicrobiales bacterium]|nr:vitamin K epoxide reductase family protein [Longimicrobiales bacterium]
MEVDVVELEPPKNRMAITLLALIGALISLYLTLHRLGVLGALLCGTGSCEVVQTSKFAVFMGVPVPYWGLAGYTTLTTLALAGLQPRYINSRPLRLALIVLAVGAFAFSIYLSALEAYVIHAWCRWCIASAVIATLIFLCTIPEFRRLGRAA